MQKRNLLISILIGFCVCLASATLFTACQEEHTHSYTQQITTEATCTEKGVITYTCSCNDIYTEEIPVLGHNEKTHEAQAPTCTGNGWNEYVTCEREGCEYSTYEEIPALTHNKVQHNAQAATCTEIGWNAYETCTRCDYTTYVELPTLNHDFTNYVSDNNATYESDGTKTAICNRIGCNATDKVIDIGSKLEPLTIQFVADGKVISTQTFDTSNKNVVIPKCPAKNGFIEKWENFVLTEENVVVNALYIKQEVWDGTSISEGFWDGNGTKSAPYTIATAQQLYYFQCSVNTGTSYEGQYIKLCANIDLGGNEWVPIGYGNSDYKYTFKGAFDGSNFLIHNYKITTSHNKSYYQENCYLYLGLFGYIEKATVSNLTIEQFSIIIDEDHQAMNFYVYTGGLAGRATDSIFTNCCTKGNTNVNVSGYSVSSSYHECRLYLGGIAGQSSGSILNATVSGNYQGSTEYVYVGGFSGYSSSNIEHSSFNGGIKAKANSGISYAGGGIGYALNNGVKYSYIQAEVDSYGKYDAYCGGIIGHQNDVNISGCFAVSKLFIHLSASNYQDAYIGGISGYINSSTDLIDNCLSYTMVDIKNTLNCNTYYAGGIVGYLKNGSIINTISNGSIQITPSYDNTFAYAGGVAGFAKGSSVTNKLIIANCVVDMELVATSGTSIDIAKIYRAEYCSIQNVKAKSEMTNKSDYVKLSFKEYIDDSRENLQNMNLWIWDENSKSLYLNFEDCVSTKYTVTVFLEDLNGEYQLYESTEINSISGILVFPDVEILEGFVAPAVQRVVVAKDGTTVVEYRYARETYAVHLIANNGKNIYIYPKYQETLNASTLATRDGYTLAGWFYDAEFTNEANIAQLSFIKGETITLYARWAEENLPSDFTYNVSDILGYVTISSYIGADNSVVVPAYIHGLPVKTISSYAFKDNANLVSLVLPTTVTTIYTTILQGCDNIRSLTVPFVGKDNSSSHSTSLDTNYILGYFFGIQELKYNATSPEGWTKQGTRIKSLYEYGIFSNIPTSLTSITITGNTTISANTFYNCINIKTFNLNENITTVGKYAFYNSGLSGSLHLPNIEQIYEQAFYGCGGLRTITIPNSVSWIGYDVFGACANLIYNTKDNLKYLGNINNPYLYLADTLSTTITTVVIDDNCRFIGNSAFFLCDKLTEVVIPKSIKGIARGAFYGCSSLIKIYYSGTVEDWKKISIDGADNGNLTSATIIYNSQGTINC